MYATPTAISSNSRKTCASHDNEVGSGISNFAFCCSFHFRVARMITRVELGSGPRAGTAELAAHSEKVPAEFVDSLAVSPRPSSRLLARTRGSPHIPKR